MMAHDDCIHIEDQEQPAARERLTGIYDTYIGPRSTNPYLKIFGPDIAVFEFRLPARPITIGRSPDADIELPERTVSRIHARLSCGIGQFILEDTGSAAGTTVNGRSYSRHVLLHGDTIEIADYILEFRTRRELPEIEEAAARAKALLHDDYHTPPSSIQLRYRTLARDPSLACQLGDIPKTQGTRLLIPALTPSTDAPHMELHFSVTGRTVWRFLGEVVTMIQLGGQQWMCVRTYSLPKEQHEATVTSCTPGLWINAL